MSKIEQLIQQLCPEGVEYKRLGEVCEILDNKRKPVTKSARKRGTYPYYGANGIQDYVSDYIFDGVFVLVGEDGSVITANGKPFVTWAEGKIWVNNHAHVISEREGVMLRFLFHYLQTVDISRLIHGTIPKFTGKDIKQLLIPLPPLPVQQEIVRILDAFTSLEAELEAELEARRKQYEYYRDTLLSFEHDDPRVEWKRLGEIGTFYSGITGKSKSDFTDGNAKFITYMNVYKNPALRLDLDNKVKINEGEKQRTLQYGDIIFTGSSETPDECGISSVITEQPTEALYLNSFCFFLRLNDPALIVPDFAKHLFRSNELRKQIGKTASGVTRFNVSKKLMEKVTIPLPPLSVQQEIVRKLDKQPSPPTCSQVCRQR